MSIGTGIFLAALLFTPLYLYRITRDRWNWRKLVLRTFCGIILIAVLGGGGIFLYEKIQDMPRKQTSYEGLKLGMTMAEVIYIKGYPTDVLNNEEVLGSRVVIPEKNIKNDDKVENYKNWQYSQWENFFDQFDKTAKEEARLDINFDDKNILSGISCYSTKTMKCPSLLNIESGTDEDALISELGKPTKVKMDGVSKKIIYKDLNVWFYLTKAQVYMMGITNYKDNNDVE